MIGDSKKIEWVVAEVLRRLGTQPDAPVEPGAVSPVGGSVEADCRSLVVETRLVTLATLDGQLAKVRHLVVPNRAVVTPAVKDELRDRDISLEYRCKKDVTNGRRRLVVGLCVSSPPAVRAAVKLVESAAADPLQSSDLNEAIRAMAGCLADPKCVGAVITDQPWAAVCQANRSSHVRAAHARNRKDGEDAIQEVDANLLIVDPRGLTGTQWREIVELLKKI